MAEFTFDEDGNLLPPGSTLPPKQGAPAIAPATTRAGFQFDAEGNLMLSGTLPPAIAEDSPAESALEVSISPTPNPEATPTNTISADITLPEGTDLPAIADQVMGRAAIPAQLPVDAGPGVVTETARAVVGGVRDGVQELGETADWIAGSVASGVKSVVTPSGDYYPTDDGMVWLTTEEASKRTDVPDWLRPDVPLIGEGGLALPEVPENETVVGGMARGITQFMAGYGVVGKAAKAAKVTAGGFKAAAVKGAVTDFATFDAHEDRFADFLQDHAGLQDPITSYLASDEDDTILEGKLKSAVEGLALGIPAEGLVRLVKAFKGAKKVQIEQGDEAAAQFMNDEIEVMAETGQLDLFDAFSDVNLRTTADDDIPRVEAEGANSTAQSNARAKPAPQVSERPAVDTESLTAALNREISLDRGGSIADPTREVEGNLFNFDKMDSDVSIKDILNMASDAVDSSVVPKSASLEDVTKQARDYLAESIDVDPDVIDASLARMADNAERQSSMIVAGKVLVQSLSGEVERMAHVISAGGATPEVYNKFLRLQSRLVETSGNLKATITGAAQATSAGRIRTADWVSGQELASADILSQMKANIEAAGGDGGLDDLARAIVMNKQTNGGAKGIFALAEGAAGPMRVINEVWINSILSGPKTHMINIISNGLNTALLPAEKMVGGALSANPDMIREGARQYAGIALAVKDATKMAAISFKQGRNMIDPEAAILEANGNAFQAIRSNSDNPLVRGLINGLGTVIRIPSRGLLSSDEFFKQLNYRSSTYAELAGQAHDMVAAGKMSKDQAQQFIADRMKTAISKDGSAKHQRGLDHAREATFTQDLRAGSISRGIQNLTNKHPALKLILPFVRTPTNLIKAGVQRTPLIRRLSHSLDADIKSGDPRRVAAARGKLATGSLLWTSAILLAQEGKITGSGPKDPNQRRLLMETGWRPYSLVVEDDAGGRKYVEYRRMDPFAMFFGIAADVADIGGQLDDMTLGDVALASVIALTNNITSKTYLTGLSDAINAMNDPQRYGQQLLNNYASSMVPMSAGLRELRKRKDPALRDVRSVVDAVTNTLPGYSETLPARRSWITGEVIHYPKGWGAEMISPIGEAFASANPIVAGAWKEDPVLDELANLEFSFSPPTRSINGVDLSPQQYQRLLELHGTVKNGSRTMMDELAKLFETAAYDKERERYPDGADPSLNPRIRAVRKVISGYRRAARAELVKEFPELKQALSQRASEGAEKARSVYGGIADLAD
ncbi:hypothetical protein [uncultured Litoreibacter sp.]|uniref:hypothetical protein n=1 Tax=uncultured Litoreibacter sp. TaxID=1392394 RepID=UPI0026043A72|nr:hypothetical protein [uncultured Litoreibacter sp.]